MDLAEQGKIKLLTNAEVVGVDGESSLKTLTVNHKTQGEMTLETDHWVPLFGLAPSWDHCRLEFEHQQERGGGRHLRLQHQRSGCTPSATSTLPRQVEVDLLVPRGDD